SYLPAEARALLHVFLRAGPFAPQLAAEGMRNRLRKETQGVVLSAEEPMLTQYLDARRAQGVDINLNYLGEAVLGEAEAEARLDSYEALLARPDVQAISIKLSSIASRVELLSFRQTLDELKPRVRRIYRAALQHRYTPPDGRGGPRPKLVSLDMEAYRDLPLTAALFQELMAEPELQALQACLVLQAYLPDSHRYQIELTRFAQQRVQAGGAPLRIRIVKGANLAAERVESALRGWPLPIFHDKAHVDANYRRMLEYACQPEHAHALHFGVASHNLFDIAFALTLGAANGLGSELSFELLEGMADALRRALVTLPHRVLLYAPIVGANAMQTAIAYLMRRLDENTGEENFLRNSFGMQVDDESFLREQERFVKGFALRHSLPDAPLRTQRLDAPVTPPSDGFRNEPDTDFALPHNAELIQRQLDALRERPCFDVPLMLARPGSVASTWRDGFDPSRPGFVPYRHALADEAAIE
ncbi:MAG TPA: proline dehydrogenase family protein, partial [Polyangiales bacterium]|nr:proline dehydrogenase family protein [Polyangiales bacterium]